MLWSENASLDQAESCHLFIIYLFIAASHSTVRTPANTTRERVLANHGKEGRRAGEEKRTVSVSTAPRGSVRFGQVLMYLFSFGRVSHEP